MGVAIKAVTRQIQCIKTTFSNLPVYTFPMKVRDLIYISYVAVRGQDNEEGAVQRVLNRRRIGAIRDFVLQGNMFFNSFIINWTDSNFTPTLQAGKIKIKISPAAAQMIDGQHRLAGLEAAVQQNNSIGDNQVLVSLCIGLHTSQAATIFLNINSEQRPVPRSLIYDLFGEVTDDVDHSINRAKDIAEDLNDSADSPFYRVIKFPGAPRGVGIIDLSAVVSALKKHLEPDGAFSAVNLRSLNYQRQAVRNYFAAIRSFYEPKELWSSRTKNPFFRSAGFNGAIDYLTSTLLMKCAESNSFTENTFRSLLRLDSDDLLLHDDIKSLDGKTARKRIAEYLKSHLTSSLPEQEEYEF